MVHVLSQDKLGLHCCPSIRISSTSFGRDHQPASMGKYDSIDGQIDENIVVQTAESTVKENRDKKVSCDSKKEIESFNPLNQDKDIIQFRNKPEEEEIDDSLFPPTTSRNSIVTASTYGISEVVSAARVAKRLKARRSLTKEEYKESILI